MRARIGLWVAVSLVGLLACGGDTTTRPADGAGEDARRHDAADTGHRDTSDAANGDASPPQTPEVTGDATTPDGADPDAGPDGGAETDTSGPCDDCLVAVIMPLDGDRVAPGTQVRLSGTDSYACDGDIARYKWSVDRPPGSYDVFSPSATAPWPTFEANVAGRYMFYLEVFDGRGKRSCEPARHEVQVIPTKAIHVELTWDTPGDPDPWDTGPRAGADMDLHFLHPCAPEDPNTQDLIGDGRPDPYFCTQYDCYWYNPNPVWGTIRGGVDDNPSLDRDDTDGWGPEIITLGVPEPGLRYEVAVHYWSDWGYGPSFATVRVYIFGELRFETTSPEMFMHDLWCTAFIDWPSGDVSLCEAPGGGWMITPEYHLPSISGG